MSHAFELIIGNAVDGVASRIARDREDDEVAESLQQVFGEALGIVTGFDDVVNDPEQCRAVDARHCADRIIKQPRRGVAQQLGCALVADLAVDGTGHELIEHGKRVAHRSPAGTHDEWHYALVDLDVLGLAQVVEVGRELLGRNQAERVVMSARANRADDLFRFGRREDELHMRGRLFDDLQQGVEPLRRDHVGLIKDEDLEPIPRGSKGGALAQVAGIINAIVGGRVNLDDV